MLGLDQVEKPEALRGRGGVWFVGPGFDLHVGVETPFRPARKAHPAFRVASIDAAIARLEAAGYPARRDVDLPHLRRVTIDDPFGNRIEILETRQGRE